VYPAVGYLGSAPPAADLPADCPLVTALGEYEILPTRGGQIPPAARDQLPNLGGAAAVALAHEGSLRALLVLGPRPAGGYSAEDLDLLAAMVPISALALASAEGHRTVEALNRELHTKVEKISEQQRRILALQQQLTTQARFATPAAEPQMSHEPAEPLAGGIIGGGPALRQLLGLARKVAASPSAV